MPKGDDNVTAVEVADPLIGTIFDKRFRVEERLAEGGFGAIYRARHVKSGMAFALKVLHPTLASDLGVLARFRREGSTLTSLRNPHTITAYEFGQADKVLFILLELLTGESLYDHYEAHGPLPWRRVVHIAKQVCDSLEEAHAQGIVHRDLKPTNIHLETKDGDSDYVKVLDFGIAKILQGSDHDASDITNAGQMIGTLDYMSPEQMVGGQVTGQTDIYTLGIVMYEMIAGTRPFPESDTAGAALASMLKLTPEALHLRAPIPREVSDVVMRCLDKDTDRRYATVAELRADLEQLERDHVGSSTATVTMSRRLEETQDEATTVTPPPTRVLDGMRTPSLDLETPRLDLQTPSVELMTKTPRVQRWGAVGDDDEEKTTTRRPDGFEPTLPAATAMPRNLVMPTPRPFESKHVPTPVPPIVVAPFSSRSRPGSDPAVADVAAALPPPMPTPTPPPLSPYPVLPPTPVPGFIPPSPSSPVPARLPTTGFDMSTLAARDAAIRRIVWIVVLVLGAGVGIIVATHL